jgi:hypothetical protein
MIENSSKNLLVIVELAGRAVSNETELKDRNENNITLMRELATDILNHSQLQLVPREDQEALSRAVEFASDNSHSDPSGKRAALFAALNKIARLPVDSEKSRAEAVLLKFLDDNGFQYSITDQALTADRYLSSDQFKYLIPPKANEHGSPRLLLSDMVVEPNIELKLKASKALVEAKDIDAKVEAMASLIKLTPWYLSTFGNLLDGLSADNVNKLIEAAFASAEFKDAVQMFFKGIEELAKKTKIPLHKLISNYSLARANQVEFAKTIAKTIIDFCTRKPTQISQLSQYVIPVLYQGNKDEETRAVDLSQRLYFRILEQIFDYSVDAKGGIKFPLKAAFERYAKRIEGSK